MIKRRRERAPLGREGSRERGLAIATHAMQGVHIHQIIEDFKVDDRTVRYWCGIHEVKPVSCSCLKKKTSIYKVLAMRQSGIAQADIRRKFGISRQRVSEICGLAKKEGMKNV